MIKLDDFRNNGQKKNLSGNFWELSDELLNRIWSIYINIVLIVFVFLR